MVLRKGVITNPSLEDFVLTAEQSKVAKETDELPAVFSYLEAEGLDDSVFETAVQISSNGTVEETVPKNLPDVVPPTEKVSSSGKRQAQHDQWTVIVSAAQTIWAQEPTVTYTSIIQRLQRMPHLKASALGESAIRKHIRAVAPTEVRGKPGRKPKKLT